MNFYAVIIRDKMINRCTVSRHRMMQRYVTNINLSLKSLRVFAKRVLSSLLLRSNYLAIKFAIKLVLITNVSPRGSIIMLQ